MKAIDADSLIADCNKYLGILNPDRDAKEYARIFWLIGILRKAPTIEPERKKGKWIYKNDLKQFFCSECGFPSLTYDDIYIYGMDLPNYCEDCGADMRED